MTDNEKKLVEFIESLIDEEASEFYKKYSVCKDPFDYYCGNEDDAWINGETTESGRTSEKAIAFLKTLQFEEKK